VLPALDVSDIAKIVNTREDGTMLEDIKNINSNEEILRAIPSIEFETKMLSSFKEIETEINENRPVIAWIMASAEGREFEHSIVVTGIDRDRHRIHYNDPFLGRREEDIGRFMTMWEKVDRTLIKVKIGKREQKLLDEWLSKKETEPVEGG
jgi:uncharacterized protein YvpB